MLGTYVIYFSMILFGTGVFYSAKRNIIGYKKAGTFAAMVVFVAVAVIFGGRYDVGSDWANYLGMYQSISGRINFRNIFNRDIEPFYLLLNAVCKWLGFSPSLFFATIEFIILYLMWRSTRDLREYMPLIIFFFLTSTLSGSVNILRQFISISFVHLAVYYLSQHRKFIYAIVFVGVAALFHYSSIIYFAFLLIGLKLFGFLDKRNVVIILYLTSIVFAQAILPQITQLLPVDMMNDKYQHSAEQLDNVMVVNSGLGLIMTDIVDGILILLAPSVIGCNQQHSRRLTITYRVFYAGIILSNIFGISVYLSRLPYGAAMLRYLVMAVTVGYLLKHKSAYMKILGWGLIAYALVGVYFSIKNGSGGCSPYQFLWQ